MDKETAVKLLSEICHQDTDNGYTWETVELDPEDAKEIIQILERQEQYAELGRLAVKIVESGAYLAINTYNSCHPEADAYTECECRKNCPWNEFCKLRAKIEGGNGNE